MKNVIWHHNLYCVNRQARTTTTFTPFHTLRPFITFPNQHRQLQKNVLVVVYSTRLKVFEAFHLPHRAWYEVHADDPSGVLCKMQNKQKNRLRDGWLNLAVRDQLPQSATRSPRCPSTRTPVILRLHSICSSTPTTVRSTSTSCPLDPLLYHGLNLNENTFQFQVIFQSCNLVIIFASLLFISRFLKPRSSTGVVPAVLDSKPTANPSHLSNAPANLYRACPLPAICLPTCLPLWQQATHHPRLLHPPRLSFY